MGVEACYTWGCSNKNKASVSFRSTYTLDFNNLSFIMSASKNYESTFNHFLIYFLRFLCNICPNTCSQEAILLKVSHLGVVTLVKKLWEPLLTYCDQYYRRTLNLVGSFLKPLLNKVTPIVGSRILCPFPYLLWGTNVLLSHVSTKVPLFQITPSYYYQNSL